MHSPRKLQVLPGGPGQAGGAAHRVRGVQGADGRRAEAGLQQGGEGVLLLAYRHTEHHRWTR